MRMTLSLSLATGLIFTPTLTPAEPPSGMVGAAVGGTVSPLRETGAAVNPQPVVSLQWRDFALDLKGASYTPFARDGFSVSGHATYRLSAIEYSDDAFFAGIDRDPAAEIGASVAYEGAIGKVAIKALGDVSGAHDGVELGLSYAYPFQVATLAVEPGVTITRLSGNLANWTYGVSESEARADRRAYDLDESWSAQLSLGLTGPISENWVAFNRSHIGVLDDATADSPLVERRVFGGVMVGVGYKF